MRGSLTCATLAYVTHADVSRLPGLQDQTLMVVRAPEETRLEIPPPTEVGGLQGGGAPGQRGQGSTLNTHRLVFAGEHQGPPEGREGSHYGGNL